MPNMKHTKESLEGLSRKKLQALAKTLGIRANQKSTEIINAILELQNAVESKRGDDESDDAPPEAQHHQQRAQQDNGSQGEESYTPPGTPPSATRSPQQPATPTRNGVEQSEQLYTPWYLKYPRSPPYEPTSPNQEHPSNTQDDNTSIDLEPSPQYTRWTQNPLRSPQSPLRSPQSPLRSPQSPAFSPASPLAQPERDYSPVIETAWIPQDVTTGATIEPISTFRGRVETRHAASNVLPSTVIYHGPLHPGAVRNASVRSRHPSTWASNIAAREEAARAAQLVEEPLRTTETAAPATPSPSPKEPKPEPYTPEAVPSTSNREITPPPYSPCEWPEGHRRQGSEGSGSSTSLSPPARPQTPEEVSERRNRFERQGSYRHFEDSDSPVSDSPVSDSPASPIGVTRTPSPLVGPGVGDPYSPYGTTQVVDPYGGEDPYYEHQPPAIRYGPTTAISSISQRRRLQTPHPRARTNPQTPQTDNSLYNPGPPNEPTPQRETLYQLPGSNESWDSIHHGPRPEANDVYHAPGSPMEERASRRRSLALVEAHVEEEEVDENADEAASESDKENGEPGYSAPNDPTDHRSRAPTPSSLPDYEDDEETTARVDDAPTSAEIQRFHVGVAAALAENARIRGTIHRQHLVMQGIQRRIGLIRDEVKRETGWEFGGLHNDENRPLSGEERMVKEQSARQRTGQENRARAPLAQLQDTQAIAPNNGSRGVKRARDEEGDEATQAAILESFKTTKKAREHEPAQEPENVQYWLTQEEEDDMYV